MPLADRSSFLVPICWYYGRADNVAEDAVLSSLVHLLPVLVASLSGLLWAQQRPPLPPPPTPRRLLALEAVCLVRNLLEDSLSIHQPQVIISHRCKTETLTISDITFILFNMPAVTYVWMLFYFRCSCAHYRTHIRYVCSIF